MNELDLTNFRGFARANIKFGDGPIVLAGVNGSGKSSVLDAIGSLLSCVPSILSGDRRAWFAAGNRANIRSGADAAEWGVDVTTATWSGEWSVGAWQGEPPPTWGEERDLFKSYKAGFDNEPAFSLPLLSYLHANSTRHPDTRELGGAEQHPRLLCFLGAFDAESSHYAALQQWFAETENLENQEKVQRGNLAFELPTLRAVRRAVTTFLGSIRATDLRNMRAIRAQEHGLADVTTRLAIDKATTPLFFDQLSDGERRMLVLVADLARRAVIGNGHLPDPLQSPGVALIDEVEMHLHPSWQRRVMAALEATFPLLQFIVSTHSPQVLSSVPNECIVVLKDFQVVPGPHHFHGRDANAILEEEMETPARPDDVKAKLEALYRALDDEPKLARSLLAELSDTLGRGDPEVTRAETLLDLVGA